MSAVTGRASPGENAVTPGPAGRKGLRTGWTTGTCAAAAAKAAVAGLASGVAPSFVEVVLPGGRRAGFVVEADAPNRCVVVKDAGDDPDCTDGARMTAEAGWLGGAGTDGVPAGTGAVSVPTAGPPAPAVVVLRAGAGVGVVTRPGLGIAVGEPSITAVPRRMVLAAVAEVTARPVEITFSVPSGEAMAARTTNARLGIVGGISILGTSGIVRPFSTAAYRASVLQQVDVAAAQSERAMVLATGMRSERAAQRLFPGVADVCFVEVGDYTGVVLRRAAGAGMEHAVLVAMVGKIAKLAGGVMMTHFRRSRVEGDLLADAARSTGAPAHVVAAAAETATARHFFEACMAAGCTAPLERLCSLARHSCEAHVGGRLPVEVVMVDFEGAEVVARA